MKKTKQKTEKHYKNYKDFINVIFKRGRNNGIKDWMYLTDNKGYIATVIFNDGFQANFYSSHCKWLGDLSRVIGKVNKAKHG